MLSLRLPRTAVCLAIVPSLLAPPAYAATECGFVLALAPVVSALVGVALGGVVTYLAAVRLDMRRRRIEAENVNQALRSEVSHIGFQIYQASQKWTKWVKDGQAIGREQLCEAPISEPVVLPAVQDKLGLIAGDGLFYVVEFYAAVYMVRELLDRLAEIEENSSHERAHVIQTLVERVRDACGKGADALYALRGETYRFEHPEEEPGWDLADLLEFEDSREPIRRPRPRQSK